MPEVDRTLRTIAAHLRRRKVPFADDLVGLSLAATDEDWEIALAGARLVVERGYHRDRDVVAAVEQLRRSPGEVWGD